MSLPTSTQGLPETLPLSSLPVSTDPVISQIMETPPLDPTKAMFEHILASMARFESELADLNRRTPLQRPPPRPDPEPPHTTVMPAQLQEFPQYRFPQLVVPSTAPTLPLYSAAGSFPQPSTMPVQRSLPHIQFGDVGSHPQFNRQMAGFGAWGGQYSTGPINFGSHDCISSQLNS